MKFRKTVALILSLAMIFCILQIGTITASAETNTSGYFTYSVDEYGEATITDCDTSISGSVTIPATLGGYPVTGIGDYAFYCCGNLKSVTIPDSIMFMGNYAFAGCDSMTRVNIGDGLLYISDGAFEGCGCLTDIGMGTNILSIGQKAFEGNNSLVNVTIPDSVIIIDEYAFNSCYHLESVVLPESLIFIGKGAFNYCQELSSITIPDSLLSIGSSAFNYTAWYDNQPDGVVYAGKLVYGYKGDIPEKIIIKDGTIGFADSAFSDCYGLVSVEIPDSVIIIGNHTFSWCSTLTSITIPDSVIEIGDNAFNYCRNLNNVIIPESVISIGNGAFSGCEKLENLTLSNEIMFVGRDAFAETLWYENHPDGPVYIGKVLYKYKGYCPETVTVRDGTVSIGDYAFSNCMSLTKISIPDSVENIGIGAFENCTELTNVVIPEGVMLILEDTFSGCSKLTDITIPNSVITIENEAFWNCDNLTNVWYTGTEEDAAILHLYNTTSGNYDLICATWNYEACPKGGEHDYETTSTTKATLTKSGKIYRKCTACKDTKTSTIYYPKTIKLSTSTYTYNGESKKPKVTVTDSKGNTVSSKYYDVDYPSGRKNVGEYKVKITFKGRYSGTKYLTFKIKPRSTTVSKLTPYTKTIKVKVSQKKAQTTGYQIQYSTSKSFSSYKTKTLSGYSNTSAKITGLTRKKTYYFRVRTYKVVKGERYYSSWSSIKYTKTK